jgi:prepilin-type N-terminal cleavage/methylation domain-containing protein
MTSLWTKDLGGKGFTLLEVLVAMGLMAVALLAVFKLQAQNLDLLSEANSMTAESCFAQDRMSRIGAMHKIEPGKRNGEFGDESPLFHYSEEIIADTALKGFYRVKVEIWREGEGRRGPAAYETYFYRRER